MSVVLDWENLKLYNSDQKKSFEELCYQIAFEKYDGAGQFKSIDDSGGGDGIEFFIEFPNGDIWGWQCKFIGRFNTGGAKEQIKKSLQRAYDIHGDKLKKWILCSRLSLTPEERIWFESSLSISMKGGRLVLPEDQTVELDHWGDSDIMIFLRKYPDVHRYFFTEKILDRDWFKKKFELVLNSSVMKAKYLNGLHVCGEADEKVAQIMSDERLADYLKERSEVLNIDRFLSEYQNGIENLNKEKDSFDFKEDYLKIKEFTLSNGYPNIIERGNTYLDKAHKLLMEDDNITLDKLVEEIRSYVSELRDFYNSFSKLRAFENIPTIHWDTEESEIDDGTKRKIKACRDTLFAPYFTLRNYIDAYTGIFECLEFRDLNELHITGGASKGKTHLAVNIVEYQVNKGKPAIFIFGRDFKSDLPLREQLRSILDLPTDWSVGDFLAALNVAGRVHNTKAILLIDGLNESIHWQKMWDTDLENLINQVNQNFPNILLITTYRESYEEQLFPENYFHYDSENRKKKTYVEGFRGGNLEEAIERYFEYYGINLENYSGAMDHFSEPLYLKIFCEAKKGQIVSFQDEDLFDVFDQYLNTCNANIIKRLNRILRYNKSFLQNRLSIICQMFWDNSTRYVELNMIFPHHLNEEEFSAIEGEDLLIYRSYVDDDVVYFTYDLLNGYLIAKYLIQSINSADELHAVITGDKFVRELLTKESLHPLYSDVLRSFCVLTIKKFGLSFYHESLHDDFKNRILSALFEVNTEIVRQNRDLAIKIVRDFFAIPQKRQLVFSLFTNTQFDLAHPLNFDLLSALLFELPMPDRELSWTEYIRKEYGEHSSEWLEDFIEYFEHACSNNDNSKRIHLAAKKVMWLLPTTNRNMRDNATRALYYYGRRCFSEFFDLVKFSLGINDPYVSERMLCALYGVTMTKADDLESSDFKEGALPEMAKLLYELMFAEKAPYSTTHILARDYARRSIDIAYRHHPEVLRDEQIQHVRPPYTFGGIREWGEFDYGDHDYGYDGPMRMDFSNYTIGRIVPNGHSYADPPEKQKVRRQIYWRTYNLGWEKERFAEAERRIGNESYSYSRTEKANVERYGKKYLQIAYFEIYGYREDNDLIKNEWPDFRPSDADIDPSFPEFPENEVFLTEDLLGDRSVSLLEWLDKNEQPNLDKYLVVENLDETDSEWVCIDGFISQKDEDAHRELFAFVRGMLVKEKEYDQFILLLNENDFVNNRVPRTAENYYTFAGEMNTLHDATYDNTMEVRFELEKQKKIVKKGEKGYHVKPEFIDGVILFPQPDEMEIEDRITKSFDILLPVAEYNWESYHSTTNQAGHQSVLAKEISLHLDLVGKPQTFDLFDRNGKLAFKKKRYYEDYHVNQHFSYLRKDVLEKFLKENGYRLVTGIWGERKVPYNNSSEYNDLLKKNGLGESYRLFKEVKDYE